MLQFGLTKPTKSLSYLTTRPSERRPNTKRRHYAPTEKAEAAVRALMHPGSDQDIALELGVDALLIRIWKRRLISGAHQIFRPSDCTREDIAILQDAIIDCDAIKTELRDARDAAFAKFSRLLDEAEQTRNRLG